jgi:hypothetical protein
LVTSEGYHPVRLSLDWSQMSFPRQFHWSTQSWPATALASMIGTLSLALLFLTVPRMLFDYVVFPLFKEAYILPQWRYRVFDAVLLAWCVDGLIAAALLLRKRPANPAITSWKRRTLLLYAGGFAVLVGGVVLGTWLRGHGY